MKKYRIRHWLSAQWSRLPLTDKCLLTFMIILMAQSAHNLFFHELNAVDTHSMDTVIRTTSAAIFGYFISGGYTNRSEAALPPSPPSPPDPLIPREKPPVLLVQTNTVQADPSEKMESPEQAACSYRKRTQQQILIITAIGIFSLLTIIIARNYTALSPTSASTLSQMRDFVSGSVGFLIGHPDKKSKA